MANSTKLSRKPLATPKKKRRTRWLILAMLPLLACAGWWAGTTIYHWLTFRPTGQIAFVCRGDTKDANGYYIRQICIVNADGSGRRQLTSEKFGAHSPAWSPDGTRMVYVAEIYNPITGEYVRSLFIMNADGSEVKQLTDSEGGYYSEPAWSPDGTRIVFVKYYEADSKSSIGAIRTDGSDEVRLTSLVTPSDPPAWSPDGAQIAFSGLPNNTSGASQVYIMNSDGSKPTSLTDIPSGSPAWSPSGKQIAFACAAPPIDEICAINFDGSGQTRLTNSLIFATDDPTWSPNGQYIAYMRRPCPICFNENGQIWLMRADGSQQTRLTDGPVDLDPAWRPQP